MNIIKTAIVALVVAVSASTYAQGVEEICHEFVQADLQLKHLFNKYPDNLSLYLKSISERKGVSPENKAAVRETAYWVYNRKDLSDKDFAGLAFLRCIAMLN